MATRSPSNAHNFWGAVADPTFLPGVASAEAHLEAGDQAYVNSDQKLYVCVNSAFPATWNAVGTGISGTIAANEVAFGNGVDSIGGSAQLEWNAGTGVLTVADAAVTPVLTVDTTSAIVDFAVNELRLAGDPGTSGEVLTSNGPGVAPTWQASLSGGITTLTGDVTAGPGNGSQAATVKAFGQKIHWVVVGGKYASLQAAVDAASANDVIVVGPIGTVSSGTWGDVTFPAQKRLSVIGLNGARGTSVRVGKVTFAPTTGLNINENEVFLRGLFINADFSGSQGVFFGGTALARLRLADCFIFNSGSSGDGIVANNTAAPSGGASSSLYIDGCLVQASNTSSVMFKNVTGYTIIRNGSIFEGGQYALQAQAGLVECFNSFFEMNAAARETIRVESAQVTMTWCRVTNSNASGVGVNITTTYASTQALFGMNNGTFLVGGASPTTPYCVKGVAGPGGVPGSLYAYGQVTYGASPRCQNTLIFTQSAQTHTSVA